MLGFVKEYHKPQGGKTHSKYHVTSINVPIGFRLKPSSPLRNRIPTTWKKNSFHHNHYSRKEWGMGAALARMCEARMWLFNVGF